MVAHSVDETSMRAGRSEWIGLAVLVLPTLLLALDLSVTFLAIPHLSVDLGAGPMGQLWIADIYPFMLAGFLITMGTLGNRVGRRRLLMIGAAAFGLASLLAAFAPNVGVLIVARALMGVAGASLGPSTLALITNMFRDPKQRAQAFAIWVSCFMGGTALGPLVGGALLQFFWWGSVFLVGVPVMVVLLLVAPFHLPEYREAGTGRIDLVSVLLSLFAILPVVYGIKAMATAGVDTVAVATIIVGLLVGVVFLRRQRSLEEPLLDLRLFGRASFSVAAVSLMLNTVAMSGMALLVNQYLQSVLGLAPLEAGLLLVPPSVVVIASSLVAPRLTRRFRPATVIGVGTTITACGCLLLTQVTASSSVVLLEVGYVLGMLGVGPMAALVTEIMVGQAPVEKAGVAGSLKEVADNLGFALGTALIGSVAGVTFRSTIDLPPGAGSAPPTIAEAAVLAERLPGTVGDQVLGAARTAFATGFAAAAATAAGLAVLIVVLVTSVLRPSSAAHGTSDGGTTPDEPVDENATRAA